jgi:CDP-glycerol glycerophosphotransferase
MIKELKQYFLIVRANLICLFLHIFWIFPIQNKQIVFSSYFKRYTCSPKYIYEYLKSLYPKQVKNIWIGNVSDNINDPDTIVVKYRSIKCLYYLLTSKIIIVNRMFPVWLPLRKNQVLINTWHGGGAYKKIGLVPSEKKKARYLSFIQKNMEKRTSFFISSCEKFTEVMSQTLSISAAKFLPYGMPRNDLFFSSSLNKDSIKSRIGIDPSKSVILYAPTFRGAMKNNNFSIDDMNIDLAMIMNAAKEKFKNDFVLLYRAHHFMKNFAIDNNSCINVTMYPEMQELLYVTDILITDYSSSMWDFSFTFKPCFLFTPDIETYTADRDFYTPITEWAFPYAVTNAQLCEHILNFKNEDNVEKIKKHHSLLGSYENGNATKKITTLMMEIVNEKDMTSRKKI